MVNKLALQHKLTDALNMRIEHDPSLNKPVVAIEFKFVHYRLVIDDNDKAELLMKLIRDSLEPDEKKVDRPKLPKSYTKGGTT